MRLSEHFVVDEHKKKKSKKLVLPSLRALWKMGLQIQACLDRQYNKKNGARLLRQAVSKKVST